MKLVVGLGNPTREYENTLHNLGFMVADVFLRVLGVSAEKKECQGITAHVRRRDVLSAFGYLPLSQNADSSLDDNEKIIIAKPQTFMNLSGDCVRELLNKYKIENKDVIVVYDDTDLDFGMLRFRTKGSAGTHNGMRNIVYYLGESFARLRVGAGRPPEYLPLKDYVLKPLPKNTLDSLAIPLKSGAELLAEFCLAVDPTKLVGSYKL